MWRAGSVAAGGAFIWLIAACAGQSDTHCEPSVAGWIDPTGSAHQWVIDSIEFPLSASDATVKGFDLDGDELGRVDNAFGQILVAAFHTFDDNINPTVAELIQDGTLIHLLEVRATSLEDAQGVGVRIFTGADADDDPSNNLGGSGELMIEDRFASVELAGSIERGHLVARLGAVPMKLALSAQGEPITVILRAATIDMTFDGDAAFGRLGGAFIDQDFQDSILPLAWAVLASMVERDCTSEGCVDGSDGSLVLGLFDHDPKDGQVSVDELRNSNLIRSLLTPDVDLYDQQGRHNPLCDGEKDALSLGLSFTAVPARF